MKLCLHFFIICVVLVANALSHPVKFEVHFCRVHGINIREGEAVSIPGECKTVKCLKASTKKISTLGCSMFILTPGCPVSKLDPLKNFPLCCSRSICQ